MSPVHLQSPSDASEARRCFRNPPRFTMQPLWPRLSGQEPRCWFPFYYSLHQTVECPEGHPRTKCVSMWQRRWLFKIKKKHIWQPFHFLFRQTERQTDFSSTQEMNSSPRRQVHTQSKKEKKPKKNSRLGHAQVSTPPSHRVFGGEKTTSRLVLRQRHIGWSRRVLSLFPK